MGATPRELLQQAHFREGLVELSQSLEMPAKTVETRAARALREMWTVHQPFTTNAWQRFGSLLTSSYELRTNADLDRLRKLDGGHPLIMLFSHRSYLDIWLLRDAMVGSGLGPVHGLAGANLNFWPMGPVLRRTGALFIRRQTRDDPIYRFVLRSYIRFLLDNGSNLGWSIEGGRTRTGKLRPPRYGALRYVIDALQASNGPEAYIVPVSVVYDQLGEVATMAAEALGESKRPEDIRWLVKFAMMQRDRGGVVRVDMGEPIAVRERIAELAGQPKAEGKLVERIALDACHRINKVTPATPTAVVTVALLAAERALTLGEVEAATRPILRHLVDHPLQRGATAPEFLTTADWIPETLEQLTQSGVLARFDEGEEPVYQIAADQHLVAAFYRNTLIHLLVTRAIGELAMFMVRGHDGNIRVAIWEAAIQLRDLLKFEFFFARRSEFEGELMAEVARIDPEWEGRRAAPDVLTAQQVGLWFERSRPHVAHLVLRPFFDAYLLVAQELAKWPTGEAVDEKALLNRCIGVGRQRVRQRKLHSAESVTLELFRNAMLLARHRQLVEGPEQGRRERRASFVQELTRVVDALTQLSASQDKETA